MLVFRVVFISPQVFKTKPENDSDITRTSQPTRSRPVVCVGLITCLELARKKHARGGHMRGEKSGENGDFFCMDTVTNKVQV
jgi:hypothetical protein